MKNIAILGSTGSIGTQSLDVVDKDSSLKVSALTAYKNTDLLEKQIRKYSPQFAAMYDEKCAADLKIRVKDTDTKILSGEEGVCECARQGEMAVTAIVGIAGLRPTLAAIESGSDIALSNKETLVTAGDYVMNYAKEKNVRIVPVDSEHSAIFQSIADQGKFLEKIIITASGGPFFGKKREELLDVTAADALRHPNWSMGAKVTVDSASMMNKGLEAIEARWLFDVGADQIEILVHPQSIVHSMVEFADGSVKAQMGAPDMRLPIQYALTWPERLPSPAPRLDLAACGPLTFERPDTSVFRNLAIALEALRRGGDAPCVMNAANEVAVAGFLGGRIGFCEMTEVVEATILRCPFASEPTMGDLLAADLEARRMAEEECAKREKKRVSLATTHDS